MSRKQFKSYHGDTYEVWEDSHHRSHIRRIAKADDLDWRPEPLPLSMKEELTQLREALARAEGERDNLRKNHDSEVRKRKEAEADRNRAEQERDTLKAECERLEDKLDKGLLHRCNHCGVELSVSIAKDGSGKSISPCDLRAQLTQAKEARKLTAVQVIGLEEEMERERLATEAVIFKQANGEMHEMIMQVRRRFKAWDTPHSPVGQDIVDCVIRHADEELTTSREEGYRQGWHDALNGVFQINGPSRAIAQFRKKHAESSTLPRTYEQGAVQGKWEMLQSTDLLTVNIIRAWDRERIVTFAKHLLGSEYPTYEQGAEDARDAAVDAVERLREQIEDGSPASSSSDIALYEAQERIKALPTTPKEDK